MKFLIIGKPKESAPEVPPEKQLELYKASDKFTKEQNHDCQYTFPGGGGMAITNAESKEYVEEAMKAYPMYDFFKWKVIELADWDETFQSIYDQFE